MAENGTKKGFSGQIGFVLAAAGSAVGVGNIWRFPYLAAKDGGGLFILVYLALMAVFGYVLLATDLALGRRTKKHALKLFGSLAPKWNFLGKLTFLVPLLIITYYPIIGGWSLKYFFEFLIGNGLETTKDNFFTNFLTSTYQPIFWTLVFFFITAFIVFFEVQKGIERFSKIIMPGLLLIIIGMAIYSATLKYTDSDGTTRTALDGLSIYLVPNLDGLTFKRFLEILLDAMSQLFFSLSVSMGIMVTYGVYVKKEINMINSIKQIEFFDTGVALICGAIIIPAIYVFCGKDAMNCGPGLMFVSLPKIFNTMGFAGRIVATLFFIMVAFAALTSCISIMETIIANFIETLGATRQKICIVASVCVFVALIIMCSGYGYLYFELKLPNGQVAQLLDVVDYVSNSFFMPLISFFTCLFVGWIIKPKFVIDEMENGDSRFRAKSIYSFTIKYVAPIVMLILFLQSTGLIRFF